MRIVIFGDSIAHGFWDTQGGWVQRIRSQYDKQSVKDLDLEYPDIYNLSVPGDIANAVVKRFAIETKVRQDKDELIIIFAVGLNDAMVFDGVEVNSAELFRGEVQQMAAVAKQFSDKIMFVGLTAVDDKICDPWRHGEGKYCFKNDRIWEFEKILRDYCEETDVPHVKIYEAFQGRRIEENLLADGLHPNEAGHQLIAELVKPELDALLKRS